MEMKTSNSVAAERRMDLASFFCGIARHGPAVVLAAVAVMSVLAAVVIYRTVRGKWRKSAAGNERTKAGRDEVPQRCAEETFCSSAEPTDVGDEGWSEVKEDVELIPSDLKIRHRRAPAEEKPPLFSPPQTLSSTVQDSTGLTDTCVEEATQNLKVAEMDMKEDVCTNNLIANTVWNAEEDHNTDRRLESELVSHEPYKEEKKVLQDEWQEVESMTPELDVSKEKLYHQEEDLDISSSPVYFEQVDMSVNSDDYQLQEKDTSPDTKSTLVEPVVEIEDAPVSHTCYNIADKTLYPDCIDSKVYHGYNHPASEEEDKIEFEEAEHECPVGIEILSASASDEVTNITLVDEQQQQTEQKEEQKELTCTEERGVPEDKTVTSYVGECENVLLDSLVSCFNHSTESKKIDNGIDGLCGTTNEAKVEISGIADSPSVSSDELVLSTENGDSGQTSNMSDKVENECNLNSLTESGSDIKLQQMDDQKHQTEQREEQNGFTSEKVEHIEEEMQSSCGDKCESVALESAMFCVNKSAEPEKIDAAKAEMPAILDTLLSPSDDIGLSTQGDCHQTSAVSVTDEDHLSNLTNSKCEYQSQLTFEQNHKTEPKEQNGEEIGIVEESVLSSGGYQCESTSPEMTMSSLNQSAEPEKDKETTTALMDTCISSPDSQELQIEAKEDEMSPVLESGPNLDNLSADQSSSQKEILGEEMELGTIVPIVEGVEDVRISLNKEQECETLENRDMFVDAMVDPTASVYEEVSFTPTVQTEISHIDKFNHMQSDQIQHSSAISEVTTNAAPVKSESSEHQPQLLSFEQTQLTWSSSGFGGESGFSSMAVSPDSQDAVDAFDTTIECVMPPVMDCNPYFEEWAGAQNSLFADDAVVSFAHDETVDVPFKSDQPPDWAEYSSFVVNEDTFGSEIESSYCSAMDQFMTQTAAKNTNSTDWIEKEIEIKAPVVEIKETKDEAEKVEEDNERTEISIMEATMDHNEWITDGSDQVLPWMNLSTSSFAPNLAKSDPFPTDDHLSSSSVTDVTCMDTNLPPFTEALETSVLTLVEENTENIKPVTAVQPIPQNVNVAFQIHYLTKSQHQMVAITGDRVELGNWKEFVPLDRVEGGNWSTVISLPAESHVEWKFVVVNKEGVCRWEECGNRHLDTGCGDELIVHRWWGIL